MNLTVPFILASRSPRRRRLLEYLQCTFSVVSADISEKRIPDESASDMVIRLANEKAKSVSVDHPDSLVLGADTIVVLDDRVLEKPCEPSEAIAMLHALSGRSHIVYTGLALRFDREHRSVTTLVTTEVLFDSLTQREILEYVRSGSPFDKAGGYGIQDDYGAVFVKSISGDFYNVMGLPLNTLLRLIESEFGSLIMDSV